MTDDAAARDSGQRIAASYDIWSWRQDYPVALDPPALLAVGQQYGSAEQIHDVLDLGCGTGALLAVVGHECRGRLVGTDISPKSCELARQAVAAHGARTEIVTADLLDLSADRLGQFDLIYCLGVIYAAPPEVRANILALIGSCLRPGGIAVLSYYAGTTPALIAQIARGARAVTAEFTDPPARVAAARDYLEQLATVAERPSHHARGLKTALNYIRGAPDRTLFVDSLNEASESLSTVELAYSLAPHGVDFAAYLGLAGFEPWYSSSDRALLAERLDLMGGQYWYGLYVKPDRPPPKPPQERAARPARDELPYRPIRQGPSARKVARWLFWRLFGA